MAFKNKNKQKKHVREVNNPDRIARRRMNELKKMESERKKSLPERLTRIKRRISSWLFSWEND